jgi:hypothetical protein
MLGRRRTRPPHGSPASYLAVLATLVVSLVAGVAAAGESVPLRLVSDIPAMQGRQAQSPIWGPGSTPRLVHEITDRDRRTWLRHLWVDGASTFDAIVPGSRSSRVEALGGAADRADTGVAWWDDQSFFFVRAVGGAARLFYFDGSPREVPNLEGRVDEVAVDSDRQRLYAAVETSGHLDVYRMSGAGFTSEKLRLSHSPTGVEHSLTIERASGALNWIAATRAGTRLGVADPPEPGSVRERVRVKGLEAYELLSLTVIHGTGDLIVYARVPRLEGSADAEQRLLLQVSTADPAAATMKILARDVYLPSGMAPRPAVSNGGRFLYYIAADTAAGNPVMRLDRTTGEKVAISLGTMGNQELAVAEYPAPGGETVPWLAVVAVGDDKGKDVRNHLYAGPLAGWPGWQEGR